MKRSVIRPLVAIAGSIALATSFAGCGGDDKDDAPATLTADEFKTQANAICKAQDAAEAETFGAAQKAGAAGDNEAANTALKEVVAVIRGEVDAIGALKAPDALATDVEALLKSLRDDLDRIDAEGIDAMIAGALSDASEKATALGLTECAN